MFKKLIIICLIVSLSSSFAAARTRLKNICRIKGQEENILRGWGLVVGLNGTGEANDGPTMRAVARAMEIMGNPLTNSGDNYLKQTGVGGLDELKKMKNVAMVMVTATVPATGARRGDNVDCYVSAINGKSLAGGRLQFASLQGPNTKDTRVFAICEGQITIDDATQPMVGVVHAGCQMEADVFTKFFKDGYLTLVLDKNHANFQTADQIAKEIDRKCREGLAYTEKDNGGADREDVKAIDAANILVRIPEVYARDPVAFASEVLDTWVFEPEPEARVVINPRAGSIVISGDLEIGDVIVSHKNVVVEATGAPSSGPFAQIDIDQSSQPKLKQLIDQLNALKVPTDDMIDIIRGIERNGKLHGRLIIE
jgi:flagellar P-ring protein FlgI